MASASGRTVLGAVWWAVAGALLGLGVVSIMTIGVALLVVGGLMILIGMKYFSYDNMELSALVGLAAIPLLMAYLYRHGPGEWCEPDGTSCTELPWGPWGFLAAAALWLIGVGLLWRFVRRSRAAAR